MGEPEWLDGPQAAQPWSSQDNAEDVVHGGPPASNSPGLAGPGADNLRLQRLQTAALLLQQRRGATAKEQQHQQKSSSAARLQQLQGAAKRLRAARITESQATDGDAMPQAQCQGQQAVSAVDTARSSSQVLTSAADAGPASQNPIQGQLDEDGSSTWPAEAAVPASHESPSNSAEASAILAPSVSALTSFIPPPPPPPPPKSPAELKRICHKMRADGLVNAMMPDSEIIRTMNLLTVAAALAVVGSESHAVLC